MRVRRNAGRKSSKNLENCIKKRESRENFADSVKTGSKVILNSKKKILKKVKLQRANGGYLGTQRRRRTWLPTKRSGELETSIDPEVSEWGNPAYYPLNKIDGKERTW